MRRHRRHRGLHRRHATTTRGSGRCRWPGRRRGANRMLDVGAVRGLRHRVRPGQPPVRAEVFDHQRCWPSPGGISGRPPRRPHLDARGRFAHGMSWAATTLVFSCSHLHMLSEERRSQPAARVYRALAPGRPLRDSGFPAARGQDRPRAAALFRSTCRKHARRRHYSEDEYTGGCARPASARCGAYPCPARAGVLVGQIVNRGRLGRPLGPALAGRGGCKPPRRMQSCPTFTARFPACPTPAPAC